MLQTFWGARYLQWVSNQVSRQFEKILIIVVSDPPNFMVFWAVMDDEMDQSWSNITKGKETFSIKSLLVQND